MIAEEKILIIDDEEDMLENCSRILRKFGYMCIALKDSGDIREAIENEHPDVILTDLKMPKKDGIGVLRIAKEVDSEMIVILVTAYATIESAVEAIKEGAFDYIQKPFSAEQLRITIERSLNQRRLAKENKVLRSQLEDKYRFDNIIGASPVIRQVFETIKKVSRTDANILIRGESGTGKELIARCIHANSRRCDKPFIPMDCASLPETLLESELFGHEKGSFTGAYTTRPGLFEYANTGTLFFDEAGELSPNLQAKLLRVLQERQFRRVGGHKIIDVDIRVISSTNRDLEQEIIEKRFREDLYYRLNVITISLPPLRERQGDIPLIATYYLRKYSKSNEKPVTKISPEAMKLLESYPWPGNVRELQNVIERAVSLVDDEVIGISDLPEAIQKYSRNASLISQELSFKKAKRDWVGSFEKQYLVDLLKRNNGNVSNAAREARIDRKTIHRLLKKYNISPIQT